MYTNMLDFGLGEDIEIPNDQRATGDEAERRARLAQGLDCLAREAESTLGWLIRVRRGTDHHLVALP